MIQARLPVAALFLSLSIPVQAQTPPLDLAAATLEDLMNIEITSASRKEQRAEETPAAIYVITRDDIRRSGMNSVPDLLRLVPGVQVAQINSNKWAVSVRGFNGLYSNKLLVLVDGRTLYNPLFATVLWDTEDLMLEDVDRIEVVRGPGAAVWGANAVNGVINILTRSTADTRGLLVRVGAGTFDQGNLAVRYGGGAGSGSYRAFAQISMHGDSFVAAPATVNDHWARFTSGLRGDWSKGADAFMLQGSLSAGKERPLWANLDPAAGSLPDGEAVSDTQVGDVLGRWTHTRGNGATLQLQSFVDLAHRRELIGEYHRQTLDLDAIYHTAIGRRHDLVAGGGYRYIHEAMNGGFAYSFTPDRSGEVLLNAFAQDEIALERRVKLTLGAKLEYDSHAPTGLQPTARLVWTVKPRQHLWTAVSRALRTPSLVDQGIRIDFPPALLAIPGVPPGLPVAISLFGNPASRNESLVSTEAGYSLDIGSRALVYVAGFIGRYRSLQTTEPSAPTLVFPDGRPLIQVANVFQNLLEADTKGTEVAARVTLSRAWQLDGTFSTFHLTPHPDLTSRDATALRFDGNAPAYQWRVHSALSLGLRAQADLHVFYVGALNQLAVPAYTRADLRFEWKATPRLSAIVQGQNLLSPAHAEFGANVTMLATEVPRSAGIRLTWRF